jgi:Fe2+ or Zn2+ uptake regulation protein
MSYTNVYQYLMSFNIRPSVQRTAVMSYMMEHHTHPTIDEIYISLYPQMPTLSRTTIYNTLNLFLERGAVRELNIDEKNARYDVDLKPHGHFRCTSCGKIQDVFDLPSSVFSFPYNPKFNVQSVDVSYSGLCAEC